MTWPWLLWWKNRHQWKADASRAAAELETSERLLREDRERLAHPLATANKRNMFSEMMRDALELGYHRPAAPATRQHHGGEGERGKA